MVGKNIRNYIQYFLCFHYVHFFNRICLACIVVILCVFVYLICICCTLCVFVVSYMFLLYLMCICFTLMCICCTLMCYLCIAILALDAGLLTRSQYPEGPATGHLDTGFSWFPCVYKRMLRWFPSFQVATTCLSCSPPDLNFLVTFFHICAHVK